MNNEFNNQDMNQVQNNNINSNYVNNYNNLNNKSDKWKNALIVVLLIISLFLIVLTIYVVVDRKDNSIDGNKDDNIQENENNNEASNNISESDALTIGNELWEYAYSTYWGSEPAWTMHLSEVSNEHGVKESICDTTIEQVKQKYSTDFKAQSCLSDGSSCIEYTIDTFIPKLTCEGAGRGGLQTYKETTLTVNSIQKDKIIFIAKSAYCGSSFCQESNETVMEIEKKFVIVKQNDIWLISNFYLPN